MIDQRTSTSRPERRTAHVIHYYLSYVVQGAEHGTDGAIVLLHDIVGGAFSWFDIMPRLAGSGRAVYAIDMLGYGQSEHPWPADTSNWGQADNLSQLFDQLNLTNIVLVGHGIGGAVAQVLATRLSHERTAALVLIDSNCYDYSFAPDWPLPEMKKRQEYDAPKQISLEDLLKNLRQTIPAASNDPRRFAEVVGSYVEEWDSELGKEVLFQHLRLLIPSYVNSVSSDLKKFEKPALIIWGQKDQQVPLKYAERLHRDIPTSRLVIVPDAAHLVLFDAPGAVADAISDFVGRLEE
jgi:pimeloyl-ACP methyl ester carboxylesterase